jgi:hypothetical protein
MFGVGQIHHRQNRGEESWQKSNSCLPKKIEQLLPNIEYKKGE